MTWGNARKFLSSLVLLLLQQGEGEPLSSRVNDVNEEGSKVRGLRTLKKSGKGYNHYDRDEPNYHESRTMLSYFEIGFATRFGTPSELEDVANALSQVYSRLIELYDDPFNRQIYYVQVISTAIVDPIYNDGYGGLDHYYQPGPPFQTQIATFEAHGSCWTCTHGARFTADVLGAIEYDGNNGPYLHSGVPYEADLFTEFSAEIRAMNHPNIVDVVFLNELGDFPEGKKKDGKGKGSKKGKGGKNKSKGGKKAKGVSKKSTSGKEKAKGGGSKTNGGSPVKYYGSKGHGGKNPKKGYEKVATILGHPNSKRGSSKGLIYYYYGYYFPPPIKCPSNYDASRPVEPLDSFFFADYETLTGTTVGVEAASQLLIEAYNTVIQDFEIEVNMDEVTVVRSEVAPGRRLELDDLPDNDRSLQAGNVRSYLLVSGRCSGCGGFTAGNQIRRLGRSSYDCPLPGLPSEEEVRLEFSALLQRMEIENIIDVLALDEIPNLPTQAPTVPPTRYPTRQPYIPYIPIPVGKGYSRKRSKGE